MIDEPKLPNAAVQLEVILLDHRIQESLLLTGVIQGAIKEIKMLREIKDRFDFVINGCSND